MSRIDKRLREVLHMIAYLRANPEAHIKDVAAALDMPPKATRELIELATMCGHAPFDPGALIDISIEKDRVCLELDQRLGKPVQLSRPEALALVVALKALSSDGDLGPAATRALERLRTALTSQVAEQVAELESRIAFEGDDGGALARFHTLRAGMLQGRSVQIEYYTASRDAMTSRRLRPFSVVQHLGQWYAIGWDKLSQEIRVFKVERIKSAVLTDERFEVPASFKPERYLKKGPMLIGRRFKQAKVRFRDTAARVVREEWPPALVEDCGDGTVIGTLQYVAFEGLANYLLAHGPSAEVVDPPELRDAVAARARETLAAYGE